MTEIRLEKPRHRLAGLVGAGTWRMLGSRTTLVMVGLGLSSGLPYLLVFGTLSVWLRGAGVTRGEIGILSYLTLTYSLKVLWAPFVDMYSLPFLAAWLGRRRAWLLLSQSVVIAGLVSMAFSDPAMHIVALSMLALLTSFGSATQDVIIDAWRIEAAPKDQQGVMAAAYQAGYRIGLILAGAGALYLAELDSWRLAYLLMAAAMGIGVVGCFMAARVDAQAAPWQGWPTLFAPVAAILRRVDPTLAFALLLVATYRLPDILAGVMANSLYVDVGFSKAEIASISKIYGVWISIFGAAVGGVAVARSGLRTPLVVGALAAAASNLMFTWIALAGARETLLILTISVDNFAGGFAGTVLIAYMSAMVGRQYTATEFALLSSLFSLPGRLIGGFSGFATESVGYAGFFALTAATGIPILLICLFAPVLFPDAGAEPVDQASKASPTA